MEDTFFKEKYLTENLNCRTDKIENLLIPILEGPGVIVSPHIYKEQNICDVYSKYDSYNGVAACDAWFSVSEEYSIPDGIQIDHFKLKKLSSHLINECVLNENFLVNSIIFYFKFYYYSYTDDSYDTYEYVIFFKSLLNDLYYKFRYYSRSNQEKSLVCYKSKYFYLRLEYLHIIRVLNARKEDDQTCSDCEIASVFKRLVISPKIILRQVLSYLPINTCWPWKLE